MIVSAIALGISNLMRAGPHSPTPTPSSPKKGFVDNVKAGLKKIASYLKTLAGKAAVSMPGLIGSVISWLFKAASQIVEVLANNVIILVIALIGLPFAVLIRQVSRGTNRQV